MDTTNVAKFGQVKRDFTRLSTWKNVGDRIMGRLVRKVEIVPAHLDKNGREICDQTNVPLKLESGVITWFTLNDDSHVVAAQTAKDAEPDDVLVFWCPFIETAFDGSVTSRWVNVLRFKKEDWENPENNLSYEAVNAYIDQKVAAAVAA